MNQPLVLVFLVLVCLHDATGRPTEQRDLHGDMTRRELRRSFGVDSLHEVPSYDTFHMTSPSRTRRSADGKHSISFQAFGKQFDMIVAENTALAKKSHVIEHHNADGTMKRLTGAPSYHVIGKLANDDSSMVALTQIDGMSGLIKSKRGMYVIQPVPRRMRDDDTYSHNHLIYEASNDEDQEEKECGFNDYEHKSIYNNYPSFGSRSVRSIVTAQRTKTMELLVAADKSMVEFHGIDFLHTYLLTMANIAAGAYQSDSLAYKMNIAVTRVVIFEQDVFNVSSSISTTLGRWHEWVKVDSQALGYDDSNPLYADNAVLITRSSCSSGCSIAGLAYSGMCSNSAQSVNNDKGILTGLTMAHELGHNLQVLHDGGSDGCKDGLNIMSTSLASGPDSFEWSSCSSARLNELLANDTVSSCFDDEPPNIINIIDFQLYGKEYSSDKQCEMALGENFTHCQQYLGNCAQLVCKIPNTPSCSVSPHPLAHGTPCGTRKWCIHGLCIPDGTPDPMVNGGWSVWSDYTECNRECGLGVQYRNRICNNPEPVGSGKDCVGEEKGEFKTCKKAECASGSPTFRDQQCTNLSPGTEPYVQAEDPCQLFCGNNGSAMSLGLVDDGTNCFTAQNDNMCIFGQCKEVGCDLNIESGMIIDRCSVCGGDGSSCTQVSGSTNLTYVERGDHEVASIPAGSKNIVIQELSATTNFIGIRIGTSSAYIFALPSYTRYATIGNATVYYEMEDISYADKLTISGTVYVPLTIYVANYFNGVSKGVTWTYFLNEPSAKPLIEWATTSWGQCSATCGGGTQNRYVNCRRMDDLSAVSLNLCDPATKPDSQQSCSELLCPAEWNIGEFSECSKSCGSGVKTRTISCCQKGPNNACTDVADSSVCSGSKPTDAETMTCSEVSCLPRYATGSWTECSKSCGGGLQTRVATCSRINATGYDQERNLLECSNLIQPTLEQVCNADVACGEWKIAYTDCTVTCGGGQQSPKVQCQIGGLEVAESLCSHETPPSLTGYNTRSCNPQVCNSFYWNTRYGSCSVTCGSGTKSPIFECMQTVDGSVVLDSLCDASSKPTVSDQSCYEGECPIVYIWTQSEGDCSVSCGMGTKPTIVTCHRESNDEVVDDLLCDVASKPSTDPTNCQKEICPITYNWKVGSASDCSVTCGIGSRSDTILCIRSSDDATVADSHCDAGLRPQVNSVSCDMGVCPPTYSYVRSYTTCTTTCGGGIQSEVYVCTRDTDGQAADDSFCASQSKPTSITLSCNSNQCPGKFYWKETVGRCIPACGKGYRLQVLHCTDKELHQEVSNSSCAGIPYPPQTKCAAQKPCIPVTSSARTPPFYNVGCYKEKHNQRALSVFLGDYSATFDWNDIKTSLDKCATAAFDRGMEYFSLQVPGTCYGADKVAGQEYYKFGSSKNCFEDIGSTNAINVNHFGSSLEITKLPPVIALGCYNDRTRPYSTLMDDVRAYIDWTDMYQTVARCGQASRKWRKKAFGIEFYGECWAAASAAKTYLYRRDGLAHNCYMGTGGRQSYYVYIFGSELTHPSKR